jgi:hypothetical protein
MNELVVNNQIVAGQLQSQRYLSDAIAIAQLIEFRSHGLKAGVRRSKHDWIAAVLTNDESSMVVFRDGYTSEAAAVAAARDALKEISAH